MISRQVCRFIQGLKTQGPRTRPRTARRHARSTFSTVDPRLGTQASAHFYEFTGGRQTREHGHPTNQRAGPGGPILPVRQRLTHSKHSHLRIRKHGTRTHPAATAHIQHRLNTTYITSTRRIRTLRRATALHAIRRQYRHTLTVSNRCSLKLTLTRPHHRSINIGKNSHRTTAPLRTSKHHANISLLRMTLHTHRRHHRTHVHRLYHRLTHTRTREAIRSRMLPRSRTTRLTLYIHENHLPQDRHHQYRLIPLATRTHGRTPRLYLGNLLHVNTGSALYCLLHHMTPISRNSKVTRRTRSLMIIRHITGHRSLTHISTRIPRSLLSTQHLTRTRLRSISPLKTQQHRRRPIPGLTLRRMNRIRHMNKHITRSKRLRGIRLKI